jgi:hypothetical protein
VGSKQKLGDDKILASYSNISTIKDQNYRFLSSEVMVSFAML